MSNSPAAASGMDIGGGRRLIAAADVLAVEVRGVGGVWTRVRVIPYEDIRAIYRFEVTDWAALGLFTTLWLFSVVALLLAAGFGGWSPTVTLASTGLLTLLVLLISVMRVRGKPARKLKIVAHSGTLVVPDRSPQFSVHLASTVQNRSSSAGNPSPIGTDHPELLTSNNEAQSSAPAPPASS
jgi:hypothetical protein